MKKTIYLLLTVVGFITLLTSGLNYSSGAPDGKTGSPGDGGATCTDCHSGTANPVDGWITTNIPEEGYTAGETYTITAMGTHDGVVKFGFEVTSEDMDAQKKGTIIVTNSTENQLTNSNHAITHTSSGTAPTGNSRTWNFDWVAPEEGTGDITFYGAFNAANGNGGTSGDVIYTSSLMVNEKSASTTSVFENVLAEQITVYPNPAADHINIASFSNEFEISNVLIFDLNGALVNKTSNTNKIDISALKAGMYHVVLNLYNGEKVSKRVIKL